MGKQIINSYSKYTNNTQQTDSINGQNDQLQGSCPTFTSEEQCLEESPLQVTVDPFAMDLGYNYTCRWDTSTDSCVRLTCGDFSSSEEQCLIYSTEEHNEACAFETIALGGVQTPVCYNNCPKRYEVVFTIDTTTSIMSERDRNLTRDTIIRSMAFLWELVQLQNDLPDDSQVSEFVKYALITFTGEEQFDSLLNTRVHFDLNNDFTTLAEYVIAVRSVWMMPDLYGDGTPTLDALNRSLAVFRNSPFDDSDDGPPIRRVEALITDGSPNIPSLGASPCGNAYNINFTKEFGELPVTFYGVFVGDFSTEPFDCLQNSPLRANFFQVENFTDLLANTFRVFSTEVCSGPYDLPTQSPTSSPTNSPTDVPTCM